MGHIEILPTHTVPKNAKVHSLKPEIVVLRKPTEFSTGKQGRFLTPEEHPGTGEAEGLTERALGHRLLLRLPADLTEGEKARLSQGPDGKTAHIYRTKKGTGVLVSGIHGSSLSEVPAYGVPTKESIKHPLRTIADLLGGRLVLVDFGKATDTPPEKIQFPPKH